MDDENKNDSQQEQPAGGSSEEAKPAGDSKPERPLRPPRAQEAEASAGASSDEPAKPEKPAPKAAPAAKAAPKPARKKGPSYDDLEEDDILSALQNRFGAEAVSGQQFLDQNIYTVDLDCLYDVMLHLRDEADCLFDYLVDLTALDLLGEEKRFCLVYHLYSHVTGRLIRVKSRLEEGEFAPSVTSIWTTADWLEREAFDMYGIEFSGHPDLRRILLPEDWHGYPLRKDYDIKLQDQSWIRKHLRIRKVPH